jgi:hypothetical protein
MQIHRAFAPMIGLCVVAALSSVPAGASVTPPRASCPLPTFGPGRDYQPVIHPEDFSPQVDNPYFPLTPGKILVYSGTKDGKRALDIVVATTRTKVIDGVRTRVVEDRLYLDDVLVERTSDYYTQDVCGDVWYFGEDTAELDRHGRVTSTEGSFRAGVDGAQPGVFMQARPELGRLFRQEWFPGQAEDQFRALGRSAHVAVPAGTFRNALRTEETTRLEPGVVDNKYFVKGIGEVKEVSVKGGTEMLELVEVIQ